jgi:hypothetical protein
MDLQTFYGSSLQAAACEALSAAQRASPPFDAVMFEAEESISDCGLIPKCYRYDEGGMFGSTGRWKQVQEFYERRYSLATAKERENPKRLLVITTSSNTDIYKQRLSAAGHCCPWISIWRLDIHDRRELKVFKELAVPAAEPKLGNKQHWLLLEYLCAPESSVETAAVPQQRVFTTLF